MASTASLHDSAYSSATSLAPRRLGTESSSHDGGQNIPQENNSEARGGPRALARTISGISFLAKRVPREANLKLQAFKLTFGAALAHHLKTTADSNSPLNQAVVGITLKFVGSTEDDAVLSFVIQCHPRREKQVDRFLKDKRLAIESFSVFNKDLTLTRIRVIGVPTLTSSVHFSRRDYTYPSSYYAGSPLRLESAIVSNQFNEATLGGFIGLQCYCGSWELFGLTIGHVIPANSLQRWRPRFNELRDDGSRIGGQLGNHTDTRGVSSEIPSDVGAEVPIIQQRSSICPKNIDSKVPRSPQLGPMGGGSAQDDSVSDKVTPGSLVGGTSSATEVCNSQPWFLEPEDLLHLSHIRLNDNRSKYPNKCLENDSLARMKEDVIDFPRNESLVECHHPLHEVVFARSTDNSETTDFVNLDWALLNCPGLQSDRTPGFPISNHAILNALAESGLQDRYLTDRPILLNETQGCPEVSVTGESSLLLISPTQNLTSVLAVQAESLERGDSGSWLIGENCDVYGHVVAIDAFGDEMMVPMQEILQDIQSKLDALAVQLPRDLNVRFLPETVIRKLFRQSPQSLRPETIVADAPISLRLLDNTAPNRIGPRPNVQPVKNDVKTRQKNRFKLTKRTGINYPGQAYAQAAQSHVPPSTSSLAFQDCMDLGDRFVMSPILDAAEMLPGQPIIREPTSVHTVSIHTYRGDGSTSKCDVRSLDVLDTKLQAVFNEEAVGTLVFLRGHQPVEWLNTIGAKLAVDPEYYRRHLDSNLSADESGYSIDFRLPLLPSTKEQIFQLRATTLGTYRFSEYNVKSSRVKRLLELRKRGITGLTEYLRRQMKGYGQLPSNLCSIFRKISVHDESHFSVEQTISLYTKFNKQGWLGIVWLDFGVDASAVTNGEFLSQCLECDVTSTQDWPTVQPIGAGHQQRDTSQPSSSGTSIPNSSDLLANYGKSLDPEVVAVDAYYALSELFRFAASSEAQFLNFMNSWLQREVDQALLSRSAMDISQLTWNLAHAKQIMDAHIQQLADTVEFMETRGYAYWPQASQPRHKATAHEMAELLRVDYQHLHRRALFIRERLESSITALTNQAMLEEASRATVQSKNIKILTLVSLIFLPLSFTASFLSMNVVEFHDIHLRIWPVTVTATFLLTGLITGFALLGGALWRKVSLSIDRSGMQVGG
ncbi:hypothetical protein F5B20DRAFT_523068 [Whalleya microplaca]|nr:hypothetical protein F5B20DRAFT_523068 [Whalleya microplaca]